MKLADISTPTLSLVTGATLAILLTATTASANCRVIHLLDQIQTSQKRLIQNPDTPSFQSDIRLIRRYANILNDTMVLDAIDAFSFSPKGLTALQYADYVEDLLNQTSIDDTETARRHFLDPRVRRNIENMDRHLSTLRCSAIELAGSELPAPVEEDFGQEFRAQIRQQLDWSIAIKGLAGILGLILISKWHSIWRASHREIGQTDRSPYETTCKVDDKLAPCKLHSINNAGARLSCPKLGILAFGSRISVLVDDRWIDARVAWADGQLSGIQFLSKLDKKLVQSIQSGATKMLKSAS